MSRQLTINNFYNSQRKPKLDMGERTKQKSNLSLRKESGNVHNIIDGSENVIDLISDDELCLTEPENKNSSLEISSLDSPNTSNATIPYVVRTPNHSISSPKDNSSSSSKKSFYSPTKKRCLSLRSPSKIKKTLIYDLSPNKLTCDTKHCVTNDEAFCEISSGLDDKSK